jgi:hypothetical protein
MTARNRFLVGSFRIWSLYDMHAEPNEFLPVDDTDIALWVVPADGLGS